MDKKESGEQDNRLPALGLSFNLLSIADRDRLRRQSLRNRRSDPLRLSGRSCRRRGLDGLGRRLDIDGRGSHIGRRRIDGRWSDIDRGGRHIEAVRIRAIHWNADSNPHPPPGLDR